LYFDKSLLCKVFSKQISSIEITEKKSFVCSNFQKQTIHFRQTTGGLMAAIYNLNPVQAQQPPQSRQGKTPTAVAVTTTAAVALPANTNRANFSLFNVGPGTLLLREGATVTAAAYEVMIPAGFHWNSEPSNYRYTGAISLITTAGTASVMISESIIG